MQRWMAHIQVKNVTADDRTALELLAPGWADHVRMVPKRTLGRIRRRVGEDFLGQRDAFLPGGLFRRRVGEAIASKDDALIRRLA